MPKIKCIALDLDGTLLDSQGRLSKGNRQALEEVIKKGIHVIIASGRAFSTLPQEIREFPGIEYVITSNGAAMYHLPSGNCLKQVCLEATDVEAILEAIAQEPVGCEAFIEGKAYAGKEYFDYPLTFGGTPRTADYIRSTRHRVEDIRKFIFENKSRLDSIDVVTGQKEIKKRIREKVKPVTKSVYLTGASPWLLEISHSQAGKHQGLHFLLTELGLSAKELAAFGDGENDMDMLSYAGYGIAMENAVLSCKEVADKVTKCQDEDGVAYGLREILKIISKKIII
ncbi:MAG: HAD family hydrolase [Lachnospiraceae bacterium]|nr:HAD family hydrolase [Lachnospiraceae bacterium]